MSVKLALAYRPDVILLDFMMPRMNGLEVVKRLREDEQYRGIPVILLTARALRMREVTSVIETVTRRLSRSGAG